MKNTRQCVKFGELLGEDSMCLAKLYPPGAHQPVMDNVTQITIENGKVIVETLFGEKQVFEDRIQTINFAESRVQLVKTAG
jgi:predicted RNA-binding protein